MIRGLTQAAILLAANAATTSGVYSMVCYNLRKRCVAKV